MAWCFAVKCVSCRKVIPGKTKPANLDSSAGHIVIVDEKPDTELCVDCEKRKETK